MKNLLITMSTIILASIFWTACGGGAKEIPVETTARIYLKMMMENKIEKDHADPKDMKDETVEPYAKAEGFTAADFKYTTALYEKDEKKGKEFGEVFGKMMMDEMMKAMGGSDKIPDMLMDSTKHDMKK
jgi:hypothetical protein